jgi:hypothetical protein
MNFNFADKLPASLNSEPILISGPDSFHLNRREYLIIVQDESVKKLYEIRYEYHCSPFKQAIIVDNILAVGHEEHFYLFNLMTSTNMLRLKMEGYFGHIYYDKNRFYIADAGGLYCIDKNASINWQNNNLAIDGVVINEFHENKILGSGEWDPPGGWRDFILNKQTGIATE